MSKYRPLTGYYPSLRMSDGKSYRVSFYMHRNKLYVHLAGGWQQLAFPGLASSSKPKGGYGELLANHIEKSHPGQVRKLVCEYKPKSGSHHVHSDGSRHPQLAPFELLESGIKFAYVGKLPFDQVMEDVLYNVPGNVVRVKTLQQQKRESKTEFVIPNIPDEPAEVEAQPKLTAVPDKVHDTLAKYVARDLLNLVDREIVARISNDEFDADLAALARQKLAALLTPSG